MFKLCFNLVSAGITDSSVVYHSVDFGGSYYAGSSIDGSTRTLSRDVCCYATSSLAASIKTCVQIVAERTVRCEHIDLFVCGCNFLRFTVILQFFVLSWFERRDCFTTVYVESEGSSLTVKNNNNEKARSRPCCFETSAVRKK